MSAITLVCLALAVSAPPRSPVSAMAMAPDGTTLLHNAPSGLMVGKDPLAVKAEQMGAVVFAPDGKSFAAAGGVPGESGIVELYSWPERKLLRTIEGHDDVITGVVFLDGERLATGSFDRSLKIWKIADGEELATLTGHSGPVLSLALSPDGKLLCSGSVDQTIRVWDPAEGKLLRTLDNHLGAVHALAFRPGLVGKQATLASASEDGTVRVWQPAINRMVRIVRLKSPTLCVAWDKDGSALLAGSKDGKVRTIDAQSDAILAEDKVGGGWVTSLLPVKEIHVGTATGELHALKSRR